MKLFATASLIALSISTTVLASPIIKERQVTVLGITGSAVITLQNTVGTSVGAISHAAYNVQSAVNASASVAATVSLATAASANFRQIASALKAATVTISGAGTGAISGTSANLTTLVQLDIDLFVQDILLVHAILQGIKATLTVTATDLTTPSQTAINAEFVALKATVASEVAVVQAAVSSFAAPLFTLATAVQNAHASAHLVVTGISDAIPGLQAIVTGIVGTVGS